MFMTMRAATRFPRGFVLVRDGTDVGWLRAGLIGFGGFADRHEAHRAGQVAAQTLAEWYATRWRSSPIDWGSEVPHDQQLSAGTVVVGRVRARHLLSDAAASSYGIELRIPHETWIAVMLELAQRMYAAIIESAAPSVIGDDQNGIASESSAATSALSAFAGSPFEGQITPSHERSRHL
jgi:hypothetical protein